MKRAIFIVFTFLIFLVSGLMPVLSEIGNIQPGQNMIREYDNTQRRFIQPNQNMTGEYGNIQRQNIRPNENMIQEYDRIKRQMLMGHGQIPQSGYMGDTLQMTSPQMYFETLRKEQEFSKIEEIYNSRIALFADNINMKLYQFGYDFFNKEVITDFFIPVGDNYVLGPGDTLSLYLWGDPIDIAGLNGFYSLEVDRSGKVFIQSIGAIYVWGMNVGEVKTTLKKLFSKKFKNFELELTLGRIRSFPVYVTGEVGKQGILFVNGTNSILDVLTLAGGVNKNGSLRDVILKRYVDGKVKEFHIDLYDILLFGNPIDIKIMEGDAIFVKPIGKTVGIFGDIKRQGIYEVKDNESFFSLINFTGGLLPTVNREIFKIYRLKEQKQQIISAKFEDRDIFDGDIIQIPPLNFIVENKVSVAGYIKYPGQYAVEEYNTLSKLLKKVELLPETDIKYGEIYRINPDTNIDELLTFTPSEILEGGKDIVLQPMDRITFYKMRNFDPITLSGEIESPSVITYYEGITLTDALRRAKFKSKIDELRVDIFTPYEGIRIADELYSQKFKFPDDELRRDTTTPYEGIRSADELYTQKFKSPADELRRDTFVPYEEIRSTNVLSSQRSVDELGSQRFKSTTDELRSDIYTSGKQFRSIYLEDLLIKGNKELDIVLAPGTQLIVKKTFEFEKDRVVTILGEVANPGTYKLTQGMTLYDLIVQAGGYTEYAYPKAMVFIRESARRQQYEQLQLTLITMEEAIAKNSEAYGGVGGSAQEKALLDITLNKQKRSFELLKRKAEMGLGRIALEIPETLEELKDSEQNIELVDGDSIYIPLRPSYVLVLGSVYNQLSLPYKKDYRLKDYIEDVGGLSKNADDNDLYVIKANGKIVSQRNFSSKYLGWDNGKFYFRRDFMAMNLEQGDTIVIPEEIKVPILWMPLIRDVMSILFQAISTVAIVNNL